MRGMLLFARSRSGWWLILLAALSFGGMHWLPVELIRSPLDDYARFSPVVAGTSIPGALTYLAMKSPSYGVEPPSTFLSGVRAIWWFIVVLAVVIPGALAWLSEPNMALLLLRNTVLLTGVGYWTVRAVGQEFGWLVGLTFVGVTVLFGTKDSDGAPQWWAVLLHSPGSWASWLLAAAVASSAWVAYAVCDVPEPRFRLSS